MDMQGNELDEFFRSSLDELEIQPSAHIWTGIAAELDAGRRKRSLVSFLSIAAGIVLVLTIGVLFIPKQSKVNKQHPKADRIVKNISPVTKTTPVVISSEQQNKKTEKAVITPANHLAIAKLERTNNRVDADRTKKIKAQKEGLAKINNDPQVVLTTRGDDLANVVVPDNIGDGILVKPAIHDLSLLENKPQLDALPPKAKAPVKRRRIRSMGDVFNVVIAAVDKRKDKFIEFSNTDEDDATITGINLGIIKVKKEK
ncbi:hypothetical protein SAMN05421821_10928 [Mucilaginibacter lappiensis]|uniref:Uncharacterized protein n=1 Tax=Mucilaginibacter lappiensis TaxID=354630 RepID=A0ABR6PRQ1_9SPHI|nr:hypothetical protein [Mucilaginibacter lappiensis]MBB6110956.1 hypothetical protein [Mucilaginibacter lappiensis]SIR59636.1 hypothetical protein SAMN05421821_10928 [Mucilaginibacter lappiensis]